MDELAKLLRGMAPGQIEEAVQLLQQYTTTNRETEKGEETSTENNRNGNNNGSNANSGINAVSPHNDTLSSVIALALRQTTSGSAVNTNNNNNSSNDDDNDDDSSVKEEYENEDDIPLALLLQSRQALSRKKNNKTTARKEVPEDTIKNESNEQQENEQKQGQSSNEETRTPNRKGGGGGKSSGKALSAQQQQSPTNAACGLANFGFLSAAKKPTVASCDKNKLFTPFVQDKRIVPAALQFWNHKSNTVKKEGEEEKEKDEKEEKEQQLPIYIREEDVSVVRQTIAVDEDTSSLMHSPVLVTAENEEQKGEEEGEQGKGEKGQKGQKKQKGSQLQGGRGRCYTSFGDMIDSVTYVAPSLHCPCGFHVNTPAPRAGFCDEVVFCGFYAVGYDPCQSRPPYFGTHNSQDSYNKEELLRLARFPVGTNMPQMSNLDYQYDSGDDWDVVDGDEDIGASSSDSDDDDGASGDSNSCNSNSSNAFMGDSEDDFINDNDDDDDSDAELQRKMVEARQRRLNRLRHKDKLVPAFSGPFVGIAMLDHPLREYDRLDRISSTLDSSAFTALLEQELRTIGVIASTASTLNNNGSNSNGISISGGGGGGDKMNDNDINNININSLAMMEMDLSNEELMQQQQQQRLLAAALRNRREMLPEELEALHAIIAANGKISPKAIVEALQQQQLCVGVARAEILRTICRYYERKHNTMVRRDEPWSATDERLYEKQQRRKAARINKNNNNNNNVNNNKSDNGGREKSGDYQGQDPVVARATSGGRGGSNNNNNNNNNNEESEEEDGVESNEDSEENLSLVALATKRSRSESRENNSV